MHPSQIRGLAFNADATKLAVAQSDGLVGVFKLGSDWREKKAIVNKFTTAAAGGGSSSGGGGSGGVGGHIVVPVTALCWPGVTPDQLVFGAADGKVCVGWWVVWVCGLEGVCCGICCVCGVYYDACCMLWCVLYVLSMPTPTMLLFTHTCTVYIYPHYVIIPSPTPTPHLLTTPPSHPQVCMGTLSTNKTTILSTHPDNSPVIDITATLTATHIISAHAQGGLYKTPLPHVGGGGGGCGVLCVLPAGASGVACGAGGGVIAACADGKVGSGGGGAGVREGVL